MKNFKSLPVTEWRTKTARGETVEFNPKMDQAPDEATENHSMNHFFRVTGALMAMIFLFTVGATAETTNDLSDAEIQGRNLAQQLLEQTPATNFTQNGILKIRGKNGETVNVYLAITTRVNADDYLVDYDARTNSNSLPIEQLEIIKSTMHPTIYYSSQHHAGMIESGIYGGSLLRGGETMIPFADSDFWLCDLGLEFFHWPEQKILKKEVKRSRGCTVLESTNPHPSANGYSRVVSWIDTESGGIVQAYAYDAQGKLLKEFYPKNIEKVNGQYQVQEMDMINDQTGSRTRLEFDLNKK
jgi:YD repeat-containing protein